MLGDRGQPVVRGLGQRLVGRVEEVGVAPFAGPADPAPDLVQLAQPEQVRPVHDQRVHRRHVDARLDDGGAHQHVIGALPEVEDHLFQCALVHLAVGDLKLHRRAQGTQALGRLVVNVRGRRALATAVDSARQAVPV